MIKAIVTQLNNLSLYGIEQFDYYDDARDLLLWYTCNTVT